VKTCKLAQLLSACLLCLLARQPAAAQTSAESAIALVKDYIEHHNAHELDATASLYAEDAVFFLNMQRPPIHGRDAIRDLERFDVAAGSTLYPQALEAEENGGRWHVHIGGVIEHSAIFEAAGATIVMAEGIDDAFVFESGKIVELRQPELLPACRDIVLGAFRGAVDWLRSRSDPRREALVDGAFLRLTPDTIPDVVALLREWRADTGQAPAPATVSACAGFDPLGGRPDRGQSGP
jgi:hypothetical protein